MLQEENAINLFCFLLLSFVLREGRDSLTVRPHSFLPCLPPSFPRTPPPWQSRLIHCYLIREERRENKSRTKNKKKFNFITGTSAKCLESLVPFSQRKVGPIKKSP